MFSVLFLYVLETRYSVRSVCSRLYTILYKHHVYMCECKSVSCVIRVNWIFHGSFNYNFNELVIHHLPICSYSSIYVILIYIPLKKKKHALYNLSYNTNQYCKIYVLPTWYYTRIIYKLNVSAISIVRVGSKNSNFRIIFDSCTERNTINNGIKQPRYIIHMRLIPV